MWLLDQFRNFLIVVLTCAAVVAGGRRARERLGLLRDRGRLPEQQPYETATTARTNDHEIVIGAVSQHPYRGSAIDDVFEVISRETRAWLRPCFCCSRS